MGQQPSKDEDGKPRDSLLGSMCCSRCLSRRGSPTAASIQQEKQQAATQPLVVEDESWKKWSSYNLIHHPPGGAASASATQYHPPVYVSQTSQQSVSVSTGQAAPASLATATRAEAVWEL